MLNTIKDIFIVLFMFLLPFEFGEFFFRSFFLYSSHGSHKLLIQAIFSTTFALSTDVLFLVVFEIVDVLNPSMRFYVWRCVLSLLIFILVVVIPIMIIKILSTEVGLPRRLSSYLALIGDTIIIWLFWKIGFIFPILDHGAYDFFSFSGSVGRLGIAGAAASALLSGYGAVANPRNFFMSYASGTDSSAARRNVSDSFRTLRSLLSSLVELESSTQTCPDIEIDAIQSPLSLPLKNVRDSEAHPPAGHENFSAYPRASSGVASFPFVSRLWNKLIGSEKRDSEARSIDSSYVGNGSFGATAPGVSSRTSKRVAAAASLQSSRGNSSTVRSARAGASKSHGGGLVNVLLSPLRVLGLSSQPLSHQQQQQSQQQQFLHSQLGLVSRLLSSHFMTFNAQMKLHRQPQRSSMDTFIALAALMLSVWRFLAGLRNIILDRTQFLDPITQLLELLLLHFDVPAAEAERLLSPISFLFIGALAVLSTRGFLLNSTFLFSTFSRRLGASRLALSLIVLVIAEVMGLYFISALLLMRTSIPQRFRSGLTAAVGDIHFSVLHRWNDVAFLISACFWVVVFVVFVDVDRSAEEAVPEQDARGESRFSGFTRLVDAAELRAVSREQSFRGEGDSHLRRRMLIAIRNIRREKLSYAAETEAFEPHVPRGSRKPRNSAFSPLPETRLSFPPGAAPLTPADQAETLNDDW